jgi:membrane-associated protein
MTPTLIHSAVSAVNVLDARSLIGSYGTVGIAVTLFIETGLLVGLVLPGDSLLFTAGVLSSTTSRSELHLSLGWVLAAVAAGALIGSQTGYLLGRIAGPRWMTSDRPRVLAAGERTRRFLERYGTRRAIVLALFVPVVRTMISPLLGSLRFPVAQFTIWQVISGLMWSVGVTAAGWAIGSRIHKVDHYLLPIVAIIIVLSLIPVAIELGRSARRRGNGTLT